MESSQDKSRRPSGGSNIPKNSGMFGQHGAWARHDRNPALPPPRGHSNAHDRPVPLPLQGRQGMNGRAGHPGCQPPMSAFQHIQRSFDDDEDDEWSDDSDGPTIYENNDRPPPPFQRRPVESPTRPPPYGGGYQTPHTQPQVPPRPSGRPPLDEPEDTYLAVDSPHDQSEFGLGRYQPNPPAPSSKHEKSYPFPSQDNHPPVIAPRPPHPVPILLDNDDDQGVYEQPGVHPPPARPQVLSGHRASLPEHGNRPPRIPSRDNSDRQSANSLPAVGPRGGSTNSNASHMSSSSSGEHIDVVSGSPRNNKASSPAFQNMKSQGRPFGGFPISGLSSHAKPLPPTKPQQMPTMTPPSKSEKPEITSKPVSGFKLPDFSRKPPTLKPVPSRTEPLPIVEDLRAGLADLAARRQKKRDPSYEDSLPGTRLPTPNVSTSPLRAPPTVPSATSRDLKSQSWFMDVSRTEAAEKINRNPQEGCFIVRPSSKNDPEVPYSLTVYSQNQLFNLIIRFRGDNKYALGNKKTNEYAEPSVTALIEHYMRSDLVLAADKGSVKLTGPPC